MKRNKRKYSKRNRKLRIHHGNLKWRMNPKKRKDIWNRLYRAASWFAESMSECTGTEIDAEEILRQSGYTPEHFRRDFLNIPKDSE